MATPPTVWGIDIGRCALKTVKLRLNPEGGVEVVAVDYVEHAKILSQPDADRNELITAAIEKFLSRNDISKDRVAVGVPGQHTLARFTKLPPVAPKRIPDIVRYEADQQIPFDMDEVVWDYQTFQQEGLPDIEVGIFAMKRELLREHLYQFEQSSIEPSAVQAGPLAVYNAAQYDGWLGPETTVLLDIGAENTDLVIATQNGLWTRTIPMGGNNFTESLVKGFKLSFAKAEGLKRAAETNKYRRQIFQAMRPVFADLVQELQRSIGFYSSTHREAEIDRVVCVGNAFKLPGLQKYLQQNLGINVELPTTFKKVIPSPALESEFLRSEFSSFAVAFGLALQGLGVTKVNSNLLPTEIAKQIVWRKKRPAFAAAAACLLVSGGLVWFRYSADQRALAAGAQAASTVSVRPEEAPDIIDNGPSFSLSDAEKAVAVQKAGELLKSELNKLKNEGKTERTDAETLLALQRNKAIVPRLLQLVHQTVPRPTTDHQVPDSGSSLAEFVAGGSAPARSERPWITIEALDMSYESDLHAYEWTNLVQAPEPLNDLAAPLPGIWLRLTCTTPNQGAAKFLNEAFVSPLRQASRKPGLGFYFDRVYVYEGGKVDTVMGSLAGGARSVAGLSGTGGRGSNPADRLDPVTGEPIDQDFRFEVYVDVVLGELPEGATEEQESTTDDETGADESGDSDSG